MQWSVFSGQWLSVASEPRLQPGVGFNWPLTTDHWPPFLSNYFRRNTLGSKRLDHIADLDVAVIGDRDTALHAVRHLAGIVLETPHRSHLPLHPFHIVTQQ